MMAFHVLHTARPHPNVRKLKQRHQNWQTTPFRPSKPKPQLYKWYMQLADSRYIIYFHPLLMNLHCSVLAVLHLGSFIQCAAISCSLTFSTSSAQSLALHFLRGKTAFAQTHRHTPIGSDPFVLSTIKPSEGSLQINKTGAINTGIILPQRQHIFCYQETEDSI